MIPKPEKRREPRRAAAGTVRVRFDNPLPFEIQGRLIDVSPSGFRMSHECTSLETGQIVDFAHVEARGRARAVWNRILETSIETGFVLIPAGKP